MEKFKAGDMVSVTTENSSGIGFLYNTSPEFPENGMVAASIILNNGVSMDGLSLSDFKTIEKVGLLTEEKGRAIIKELDEFATGLDKCSLGLPKWVTQGSLNGVDHTGEMIHIIRIGLIGETVEANFNDLYHHSSV
jgi:hypothetical protein